MFQTNDVEQIKRHIYICYCFPENLSTCEIISKTVVEPDRTQISI
jgi:hypothetical protein